MKLLLFLALLLTLDACQNPRRPPPQTARGGRPSYQEPGRSDGGGVRIALSSSSVIAVH
jgi:hypothetical protein